MSKLRVLVPLWLKKTYRSGLNFGTVKQKGMNRSFGVRVISTN
jgi:hypothetical protein